MADSNQSNKVAARRSFLHISTGTFTAVGASFAVWPLIHQMNPAADTLSFSTLEVDLSGIEKGQAITVQWQGKPVFIRRRTSDEIEAARNDDAAADLRQPEADSKRAPRQEWIVMIGVCSHLGCIPLGQKNTETRGDWNGWFCPCHGSHYDTSGRIRKGPAPNNLEVPRYEFLTDTVIRIG